MFRTVFYSIIDNPRPCPIPRPRLGLGLGRVVRIIAAVQ